MILTCPNCSSRFLLSAQALAPEGRRVKCSSCDEEWFELPDPDELLDNIENEIEEIPESVKPLPEGSYVPALQDEMGHEAKPSTKANIMGYVGAFMVFVLSLGVLVFVKEPVMKLWPPSAAFYETLGVSVNAPGEGLVFDRVKANLDQSGRILIQGSVINITKDEQALPSIEASVRDEAGDVIESTVIHPPHKTMKGETTLPFQTMYGGDTSNADHVQLRFVYADNTMSKSVSAVVDNTAEPPAPDPVQTHDGEAH